MPRRASYGQSLFVIFGCLRQRPHPFFYRPCARFTLFNPGILVEAYTFRKALSQLPRNLGTCSSRAGVDQGWCTSPPRNINQEQQMMKLMGFSGFDTTKGKGVEDNKRGPAKGAVSKHKAREYRQYMNRRGAWLGSPDQIRGHEIPQSCTSIQSWDTEISSTPTTQASASLSLIDYPTAPHQPGTSPNLG